jgi:hypothetical protein
MRFLALSLLLAGATPALAFAQAPEARPQDAVRASASVLAPAPTPLQAARAALTADAFAVQDDFNSRAPGASLMIAGAAGIIAGALVGGSGGTLLILAGVGVGAYGFYLYNQ